MEHRYPFIAIEGMDGTGKTTVRKGLFRLWESLYAVTPLCILTTNFLDAGVGGDIVAGKYAPTEANRDHYMEALAADKQATLTRMVGPALPVRPVLSDRWLLSELAFFAAKHSMRPHDTYQRLAARIHRPLDATLVLDLPVEESLARSHARSGDATRSDWDTLDVQQRVRAVYESVLAEPDAFPLLGDVVRIDAADGPAAVLHQVWTSLRDRGLIPASVAVIEGTEPSC